RMADDAGQYFTDFSEIVGKQLRRSVSTGLPIAQGYIGEPIVVSSGELVEIESVAGSISVKTAARALSGGAVGELINVEIISSRKRIAAMVVGPLQVRVAGGAPISRSSAAETTRSPGGRTGQTANRLSQDTSLR
ncbi:MAG: flagellar basal body P-ring formation chaperone FlgA, partial [Aureliella sp.]